MEPYGAIKWQQPLAPISPQELLHRWPKTVSERINRTLCNLAVLSQRAGDSVAIDPQDAALAFAETPQEAGFHLRALQNLNLLNGSINIDLTPSKASLTPSGWARFEELTQGRSQPENPAFVAMWFGGTDQKAKMDQVFQLGIQPAIEDAGYLATRVDLTEHNDWIMDKVLADIRLSPFVVADCTGHRNGVYYEAGFARGLGIPVIHTCDAKDFANAHFDTAQLNHVLWDTAGELKTKLYHRIMGTIGRGPHYSKRSADVGG
jgi:hypothetical protein